MALNTLSILAARGLAARLREEHDAAVAEARARLGREPTEQEVREQYTRRGLRRRLGREPTDVELERFLTSISGR